MTDEPMPDEIINTDILEMPTFGEALDRLRRHLGMTMPYLAREAGMSLNTVVACLGGLVLPSRFELHNLLIGLKISDRSQQQQWEYARVRIGIQQGIGGVFTEATTASSHGQARADPSQSDESAQANLLFRVYIPSGRLYAAEASKLLSLFREWLTATRRYGVRQSEYHASSGKMYEFFVDAPLLQSDLREEFDNFSDFLALCSEDAPAAADMLASSGMDRVSSIKFVARFGKEVRRLQIDLRHEREQRVLTIRHSLEDQLLENGIDLQAIPTRQLNTMIGSLVPRPSAPESLALLAAPWTTRPTAPVTVINNPQIISAMESTIIQNVQGTIHLGLEPKKLLDFIDKFGGQETATLQSAVYELEDPAAPPSVKSSAKQRLKQFLSQVVGFGRDVTVELFADYLRSKGM
jgi:transcriptional regulator with XRE-family HTH domain